MGLPEVNISFSSLSVSAIQRSQRGIVALIMKDDTGTFDTKEYKNISEIQKSDWSESNFDLIQKAFMGVPSKIIVERLDSEEENYSAALLRLANKRWNYLAIPGITSADVTAVATQVKTWRDVNKKTFKVILPNHPGEHEGVINFATEGIKVGETIYSASQYTSRIAGILAGIPLTSSSTNYELTEVDAIVESTDPDSDVDDGKLILIKDDDKFKIARGVNSLTTITQGKGEDWKKIKIIEGHDLVKEDITRTFKDNYSGKVNNNYDNQVLFLTSVNAYFRGLQGDVLDAAGENAASVDVEAQRLAWESVGTDTSEWDDQKVKENSFRSSLFAHVKLKFLDAIEDLDFKISV
ncbi:phage tail sheath C-terminal domain-containing protein [Virgibacillus siamensis]|uniref:phage tail sheath C-terminal domain-containing protein n=2 Tax=Bacillati TaxID=1783272 RepID=UPI003635FB66